MTKRKKIRQEYRKQKSGLRKHQRSVMNEKLTDCQLQNSIIIPNTKDQSSTITTNTETKISSNESKSLNNLPSFEKSKLFYR